MRNEDNNQNLNNLIPFPRLKERLFQKGIERLESHRFEEAANLLRQAQELDSDNSAINMALIVALYESADYEEAKRVAEEVLHHGTGEYYEVLDIYLMVLIQLNEHDRVIHTIETLFEEQHVPIEKEEHLRTLLQLSKKIDRDILKDKTNEREDEQARLIEFEQADLQTQIVQIGELADKNIQPYVNWLIAMVRNEHTHPFVQTVALNVMKEHRITTPIHVAKLGFQGEYVPEQLPDPKEMSFFQQVKEMLTNELDHENPVLLEQLCETVDRHVFFIFPFEPVPSNPALWAAAYRALAYEWYGEAWEIFSLAQKYGVPQEELHEAVAFVRRIEEALL